MPKQEDFVFVNLFDDEDDYGEIQEPAEVKAEEPETAPEEVVEEAETETKEVSELERLKAENEALKAQKLAPPEIDIPVVEPPKSIVEEWKTKFGLENLDEFGEAAPLLTEIDQLRNALYERDKTLAELSSHPTVKQAKLEQETIAEIQQNSSEWQEEFLDMFDRADEIKKLPAKKAAELGDFIGSKVVPLMTQRKLNGKKISNPLLALQKDISAKLDELIAPKKQAAAPVQEEKPQFFQAPQKKQEQTAKKMMSLNPEGQNATAPELPHVKSKEDAAYIKHHLNKIKHVFDFAEDI